MLETLARLGLTPNQARILSCLLEHGSMSASKLAQLTGIQRPNTYYVLRQLQRAQLATENRTGKRSTFTAQHPAQLRGLLQQREEQLGAAREELGRILPRLVEEYALSTRRAGVFWFEGQAGLKKVYDDLLREREDLFSIINRQAMRSFIPELNRDFGRKRERLRIAHKVISTRGRFADDQQRRFKHELRFLDLPEEAFQMDLKITQSAVVFTTFQGESAVGIILRDGGVAKSMLGLFHFLWELAVP